MVKPRAARPVGVPRALGRHPVPLPAESRCALRNLPARPGAVCDGRLQSVLRASPLRAAPKPSAGRPAAMRSGTGTGIQAWAGERRQRQNDGNN